MTVSFAIGVICGCTCVFVEDASGTGDQRAYHRWGLDPSGPSSPRYPDSTSSRTPSRQSMHTGSSKEFIPVQLVLAGGGATDDPESEEVIRRD